jgi:hypothetical protein
MSEGTGKTMATLGAKDSRSTLVDERPPLERTTTPPPLPSSPLSPASPFSASFDPNNPTPLTPPANLFSPMTSIVPNASATPLGMQITQDSWRASLGALALQFAALATMPTPDRENSAGYVGTLSVIEQAQERLKEEIEVLREQVEHLRETRTPAEKEKEREHLHLNGDVEGYEIRIQAVEKRVEDLAEAIRLE